MDMPTKEEQDEIAAFVVANREKFARSVDKIFYNITEEDIDDCLQKLYIRILQNYAKYKSSPNKTGWLFLAFRNVAAEHLREKGRQQKAENEEIEEKGDDFDENDIIFGILTNHLTEEQLKKIVLSELNEKERTLYRLRFEEKKMTKEIARELRVPHATVRRRIHDLKNKVAQTIHSGKLFEYVQKNSKK